MGVKLMSDRAPMLQRIRDSLATNGVMLEKMAALAQTPYPEGPFIHGEIDPVEQFMDELRELLQAWRDAKKSAWAAAVRAMPSPPSDSR